MSAREMALAYISRGYVPIPIPYGAKAPGHGWNERTVDSARATFEADFPQHAALNIGVRLGAASKLADVDLDCPEAIDVAPFFLPPTLTFGRQSTPRAHWIYTSVFPKTVYADPKRRAPGQKGMLVELRGDGCQTVFPGSVHPSGELIRWDDCIPPIECPDLERRVLLIACAALLVRYWPDQGLRHNARLALAGCCLRLGWPESDAEALVGAVTHATGGNVSDVAPCVRDTYAERVEHPTNWGRLREYTNPETVQTLRTWLEGPQAFQRGDNVELADRLLDRLGAVVAGDGQIWQYDAGTGLYQVVTEKEQSVIVQSFAGQRIGTEKPRLLRIDGTRTAIQLANDRIPDDRFFEGAVPGLAFRNAFVTLDGTKPHGPDNRARAGYDFDYVEGAEPFQFLSLLGGAFLDCPDAADRIQCLFEFLGACLFGIAWKFQRAIVLVSIDGDTGKSTIVKIMRGVMPAGTAGAIEPQSWGSEYSRAKLAGLRFNAVAELPAQDISASEAFKAIIAGDEVRARFIYEREFDYKPIAGHMFSTQQLPATPDVSTGFFRRLIVMRVYRVLAQAIRRIDMAESVLAAEKGAIISRAIAAVRGAVARNTYTIPPSSDAQTQEWRAHADAVASWVDDSCERAGWTDASMLYRIFQAWCAANGFKIANINTFGMRLVALGVPKRKTPGCIQYMLTRRDAAAPRMGLVLPFPVKNE